MWSATAEESGAPAALKLQTDFHIEPALAVLLRAESVEAARCQAARLTGEEDGPRLEDAARQGRAVATGGEDFLGLHSRWQADRRTDARRPLVRRSGARPAGQAAIGPGVKTQLFYHPAMGGGAATVEKDVYNQVVPIP